MTSNNWADRKILTDLICIQLVITILALEYRMIRKQTKGKNNIEFNT